MTDPNDDIGEWMAPPRDLPFDVERRRARARRWRQAWRLLLVVALGLVVVAWLVF